MLELHLRRNCVYLSIINLMTLRESGRGWMASRLPRGIWRTTAVDPETAWTSRVPRSTARSSTLAVGVDPSSWDSGIQSSWCFCIRVTSKKWECKAIELIDERISRPSTYNRPLEDKPIRWLLIKSTWLQHSMQEENSVGFNSSVRTCNVFPLIKWARMRLFRSLEVTSAQTLDSSSNVSLNK